MTQEEVDSLSTDRVKRVEVVTMSHGMIMEPASVLDAANFTEGGEWELIINSALLIHPPGRLSYDPLRLTLIITTLR